MKNNKGFTLIELLAVVLILGVIALVAIPTVSTIVKESKKNAFETGIKNVIRAAETKCLMEEMSGKKFTNLYTFTEDGVDGDLEVNGSLPTDGTIALDETCKTEVAVSNKEFCANKGFGTDKITISDLKDGECVGYNNDIKDKINVNFVGDNNLKISNLKSSITKNNELVYEFTLQNNSTSPVNYKLQFNDESEEAFKYVNMQVIKDYIVEYNDSLTKVANNNVFEIANLEPNSEYDYRLVFKGNTANFKFDATVNATSSLVSDIPSKVTVTMAKNSKNEKNFTWHINNANAGTVQVVKADNKNKSIVSFDANEIIEATSIVGVDSFSENVHKAKVTNLEPGTDYYYRVGDKNTNVWSNVGKFTTDNGDSSFSFIYMADMQSDAAGFDAATYTVVKSMEKSKNAEFLINTGDFVNTPTSKLEWDGILKYNSFGNITSVAVAGNHDYDYIEKDPNVFSHHFNFDCDSEMATEGGMYYSFDYGNVHFISVNANDYLWGELTETQTEWLLKDLQASQGADFRIVIMHRGVYTPGPHFYDYGDIKVLTEQLTPIFDEYNVDLVLQGHDHVYGLTYPINKDYEKVNVTKKNIISSETNKNVSTMVKPGSPVYFINNAAGSKYNVVLTLKNGEYVSINPSVTARINATKEEIDEFYPKFQKIATPLKSDGTNLALFSSIQVKGKTLLVNTYSVDNQNAGEVKLYDSFGISK